MADSAPARSVVERRSMISYDCLKRGVDALVAGLALVGLSPVILAIALLVRFRLGGNVLFRQRRLGLHGRVFEILKFRTMLDPDPARGLVEDEDRMTAFGEFLRATSLDELPSLLNVLRGDMSLVGPRPLIPQYLERYTPEQARRHEVLPGLTGLAQVSGRNSLSWDDRFELDLHYVRTRSLSTDLRILLATVPKVLGREGITEEGGVTMSVYCGPRRIGNHEIRPVADFGRSAVWEVVDRVTGTAVAHCGLECAGTGEAELVLFDDVGSEEPELIRLHTAEMLVGIAREKGARTVRIAIPQGDRADRDLWTALGFHAERETAGNAPLALVRTLGGSEL